jgi:hypothetical protein
MENEIKINAIDVQKELMKSKVMAKFSHYEKGKLFYTVELENGVYQFPIETVERQISGFDNKGEEVYSIHFSEDLGSTKFFNEVKGSELFRWIKKAIASDDFMKIS